VTMLDPAEAAGALSKASYGAAQAAERAWLAGQRESFLRLAQTCDDVAASFDEIAKTRREPKGRSFGQRA